MYPMLNNKMSVFGQPSAPKADGDGSGTYPYLNSGQGTPPLTGDTQGGGDGGWLSQLGNIFTNQMNNFSGALSNPLMIPSLAAAMQQYHQAHQYTDMAENYANRLDPFGSQRAGYQQMLLDSYTNPEKVLNDPAHMAELNHGLSAVGDADAAKGLAMSSGLGGHLMDYARMSDADWLNNYRKGLMPLTGEQFGPDASARMLETGLMGRMGAENNAIGDLMLPFMNQSRNNIINNGTGNPGGFNGPGGAGGGLLAQATRMLSNPGMLPTAMQNWSPQQLAQWLRFNNPLGNDPTGNWLSGGSNGMDGGISGADGGLNDSNIFMPGQDYSFQGPPNMDWSGGWSDGGYFNDPGIADGNMGLDFTGDGFDPSMIDFSEWDPSQLFDLSGLFG